MNGSHEVLLRTLGICKAFSSVTVLRDVGIEVFEGEIVGIIGENGAGKSTLMKILSGIYTPSSGNIFFQGRQVSIPDPLSAKKLGISILPQEFNLVNELAVYDNVFLGSEIRKKSGLLDKKAMMDRTTRLLGELHVEIRPDAKIEKLSTAQKQMVEICKAVSANAKLLIMDEPTTVLTSYETNILFSLMRRLQAQGTSIIYISHKLKEVRSICARVVILRDGEVVHEARTADISEVEMAQRMVGRELSQVFPAKVAPTPEIVFEARGLCVPGVLHDVGFQLHKGEILGIAGLVDAGKSELGEVLFGARRRTSGQIFLNGKEVDIRSPRAAVDHGIDYLPEDRQGTGVLTSFSVTQNITLVSLSAYCSSLLGFIHGRREDETALRHKERFNIKVPTLSARLESLSGGNQQKVSLAKSIDPAPQVLIANEPTRGVDVAAKHEIYRFINTLTKSGLSCILISSEQEEIIGMCHRVIVMKEGRIMGTVEGKEINEQQIMFLATGVHEGALMR